ncbi:serine/threonine protein kinase, partial [bacterium]|nr:serine/threonine protein kinase [bacterium]
FADSTQHDSDLPSSITSADIQSVTIAEGLGDPSTTNLAELAGASADAIRPLDGRFALASKLGKGGMGEVFAARDSMLNREVAVKILSSGDNVGLARFVREAQVTAQLSHPNVVPVYGLEETGQGNPALTMKLIRGDTFAQYIKQCASLIGTPDYDHERHGQIGRIEHFLRVCDAISYSHSRGVIHRDLKPENLMLGGYGEVYVMDWGIARLLDEPEDEPEDPSQGEPKSADDPEGEPSVAEFELELGTANISGLNEEMKTRVGALMGTPTYMPPEQVGGKGVGPKSDQFSLGMVLFEMLTFAAPRKISKRSELIEKVTSGSRVSFSDVKQHEPVPPSLQAIVDRATAKDPLNRYPSVEEFSDDLRRFIHGEEVSARPDNFVRSLWRRVQRHPIAVMSALLIALTTAGVISTVSLYRGLEAERVASRRGQTLAGLVANVSQRVSAFDTLLFKVEGLLEGVATSSREQLEHAPAEPYPIYQPDDLKGENPPEDLANIQRYQQRVSFDNFVVVLASGVQLKSVQSELFQLNGLRHVLRNALLRSARIDASELEKDEADSILRAGTPIIWSYVGLENGAILNYPGNEKYPPDYDTRKRPWYVSAVTKKHGSIWGSVYPDATGSGYLMPCNQPFYDQSGKLLGVAGLDLSMDTVIEEMEMPDVDGIKETWLMDDSGRVVLTSGEKGSRTAISMSGNRTKELGVLGIAELEEHAKKGTTSGFVMDGEDVLVFARLEALPWILVARVDARSHGL